jgi:tetratricopeptide (TPR) repeat protein
MKPFWAVIATMGLVFTVVAGFDPFEESLAPAKDSVKAASRSRLPSIVSIRTFTRQGAAFDQGIGFFITGRGDIIASRHVFDDAYKAEGALPGGKSFPIDTIVAEDKDADLLWLRAAIPSISVTALPMSNTLPAAGDRIMVIAGPDVVSDGQVTGISDVAYFGQVIRLSVPLSPGASGSPAVTMEGSAVGIVQSMTLEGKQLTIAIPGDRMAKLKPGGSRQTLAQWQGNRCNTPQLIAEEDYRKGIALLWGGHTEQAATYFEKAASRAPKYTKALAQMAWCYSTLGQLQKAIEAGSRIVKINPKDVNSYYNLALLYGDGGYMQNARETLEAALRIKPDFPEGMSLLAWVLIETGADSAAVDLCKKAIAARPDYDNAHLMLGRAYAGLGIYEWAANALHQALRINPNNDMAYLNLGVIAAKQGDIPKAFEMMKKAIALNSENYDAFVNLGALYETKKDRANAVANYVNAERLKPADPKIHLILGKLYLASGNRSGAQQECQTLVPLDVQKAEELRGLMDGGK